MTLLQSPEATRDNIARSEAPGIEDFLASFYHEMALYAVAKALELPLEPARQSERDGRDFPPAAQVRVAA